MTKMSKLSPNGFFNRGEGLKNIYRSAFMQKFIKFKKLSLEHFLV